MNFWYSLVDPDKEYMHGRYDHVKKKYQIIALMMTLMTLLVR